MSTAAFFPNGGFIAKYLDAEMRRGQKAASGAEFEAGLKAALGLYGFMAG